MYSWKVEEYDRHHRTKVWYMVFFALVAVVSIYALVIANFLFLFIILMIAAIVILERHREPRILKVSLMEGGVKIGQEWHPWSSIEYFWIVDEPEARSLYFETKGALKPHLCVSLRGQNIEKIRSTLKSFLKEERHEEPLTDIVSRLLKI